ncbi:hypothetical protein PVA19_15305 [Agrobacterium sp. CNPSo 3708]|uniref:hypothetical protein n=1 Tax=Agrobacterium sp. CNPSo 3708 TaxID=3028150 RepID=UPI002363729C|nr:hypothetical protein [Agrobacterium sp. CNPSo 3708]MDD1499788.1 hypothetical protein [Agrobacterium sp. CNPSo 3708]
MRPAYFKFAKPILIIRFLLVLLLVFRLQLGDPRMTLGALLVAFTFATFRYFLTKRFGAGLEELRTVAQIEIVKMCHKADGIAPATASTAVEDILLPVDREAIVAATSWAWSCVFVPAELYSEPPGRFRNRNRASALNKLIDCRITHDCSPTIG